MGFSSDRPTKLGDKTRDDQVIDLMIEARRSITAPIPCDVLVSDLARFEFNKQRLWHIEHQIARSGLMAYEREPKIPKESFLNPPPPDEIADATEFLKRAKSDLVMSDFARENGDKHNAGFHAQQACEKALKALLIALRNEPPRTHDLVEIANKSTDFLLGTARAVLDTCEDLISKFKND